jgi:hypothetical protein
MRICVLSKSPFVYHYYYSYAIVTISIYAPTGPLLAHVERQRRLFPSFSPLARPLPLSPGW